MAAPYCPLELSFSISLPEAPPSARASATEELDAAPRDIQDFRKPITGRTTRPGRAAISTRSNDAWWINTSFGFRILHPAPAHGPRSAAHERARLSLTCEHAPLRPWQSLTWHRHGGDEPSRCCRRAILSAASPRDLSVAHHRRKSRRRSTRTTFVKTRSLIFKGRWPPALTAVRANLASGRAEALQAEPVRRGAEKARPCDNPSGCARPRDSNGKARRSRRRSAGSPDASRPKRPSSVRPRSEYYSASCASISRHNRASYLPAVMKGRMKWQGRRTGAAPRDPGANRSAKGEMRMNLKKISRVLRRARSIFDSMMPQNLMAAEPPARQRRDP